MVPEGWKVATIEDIAQVTSGGTPSRKNDNFWGGDIPWVTTAEVQSNVIDDTAEKITEAGLKGSSAKLFPVNTLLRSEEHTSELQSRFDLVCCLLLEKKNIK